MQKRTPNEQRALELISGPVQALPVQSINTLCIKKSFVQLNSDQRHMKQAYLNIVYAMERGLRFDAFTSLKFYLIKQKSQHNNSCIYFGDFGT